MQKTGFDAETSIRTLDGDELVLHLREVPSPTAAALIVHGAGEHAGRYGRLAEALAGVGIASIAPDQLGHGQTGRRGRGLSNLGPGGNARALRALADAADEARRRYPDLPLILFGHSWGSLLGQKLLELQPRRFSACILSGTSLAMPGFTNTGRLNKQFEPDPTGLLWLSRDPDERRAFAEDPDCFDIAEQPIWTPIQSIQLLGLPPLPVRPGAGDVPVLIINGSDDPVGHGRRGATALAWAYRHLAGRSDVTLRIYEGARHEVLNETNRDEVTADLLAWLAARFPLDERAAGVTPDGPNPAR